MAKKQPNPIDVHVGQRVRLRRMIVGVSQGKLGDSLGIRYQQVQKYEKGANRISASRLQQIANFLSVPVPYFFEDAPGGPAEESSDTTSQSGNYVVEFLSSAEGLQLNKAFVRIKDAKLRRSIVELVRALADDEEAPV